MKGISLISFNQHELTATLKLELNLTLVRLVLTFKVCFEGNGEASNVSTFKSKLEDTGRKLGLFV